MSDWRDVMEARSDANKKMIGALRHVEDPTPPALQGWAGLVALTFCAQAVCAELRALGVTIDYAIGNLHE